MKWYTLIGASEKRQRAHVLDYEGLSGCNRKFDPEQLVPFRKGDFKCRDCLKDEAYRTRALASVRAQMERAGKIPPPPGKE